MSKGLIAAIVAGVIVVGGGVAFVVTQQKDTENQTSTSSQDGAAQTQDGATLRGSLVSLLEQKNAKECTYSTTVNDTEIAGTVFLADGKMRNNYTATKEGSVQSGSMIVTDGQQFVWDNESKKGVKFAFTKESAAANTTNPTAANQQVDVNKEYDFSCKSWNAEADFYVVPEDIQIQDLSQLQSLGR